MGDPAMVLQALNWARECPQDVEVGRFCCENGGHCGVGRFAVEAGASNACAGEEMRDWLHVVAIIVAEWAACSEMRVRDENYNPAHE